MKVRHFRHSFESQTQKLRPRFYLCTNASLLEREHSWC